MESVDRWVATGDICRTCQGVLRLQARWTRLEVTGDARRQAVERLGAEARWFVQTLEKVRPCPSHAGVLRLARHLTESLATVGQNRSTVEECQV